MGYVWPSSAQPLPQQLPTSRAPKLPHRLHWSIAPYYTEILPRPPPLMVWKDPLYLLGPFSNSTGLFAALVAHLTTDPSHSHPKSQGLVMARRPP